MLSQQPVPAGSPGHGTLFVEVEQDTFIIDATMLHGQPPPLREGHLSHPVWGTHTHQCDGNWYFNWKPLGRPRLDSQILYRDASAAEYAGRHEMSRYNSRFDGALLIRLAQPEGINGIIKGGERDERCRRHWI